MVSSVDPFFGFSAAFHEIDEVLNTTSNNTHEEQEQAAEKVLTHLQKSVDKHRTKLVRDVVLHPEYSKTWRKLGPRLRAFNSEQFKSLQNIVSSIQVEARKNNKLIQACATYDIDLADFQAFLSRFDGDVNKVHKNKHTPLTQAIEDDRPDFVKVLVLLGANIDAPNDFGFTPLTFASMNDQTAMVKLLKELGANLNAFNTEGGTAITLAIDANKPERVKLLAQLGADLNKTDNAGWSPLNYASYKDKPEMIAHLVKLGADPLKTVEDAENCDFCTRRS